MSMRAAFFLLGWAGLLFMGACQSPVANPAKYDYAHLRAEDPRSILIVPVVNRTVDVTASDSFLSTISRPVAERGYYVYPVHLVKRLLEDDGLSDADMVHKADPRRLGALFGADAILYVTIDRWDAKYAVLSTSVEVEFRYLLKSGRTGDELWSSKEFLAYSPGQHSTGNPLADLIGAAVTAGITKAAPNHIPMAQQANANALVRAHKGLPAGPYLESHKKDGDAF